MAGCKSQKYAGRVVLLEFQIGCGDVLPSPSGWKRFAAMRTKEFNLQWDTIDATADDSIGALRDNIASFQTLTMTGDGVCKASGKGAAELLAMTKHVVNPQGTAGQPVVWLRMTFPDLTFTALMIVTNMSRSAPYDDLVTFSMEASATASDFGLIMEDTPDPDADPVTSVSVLPETASIAVGATQALTTTVLPAGAPQNVQYSSALPSIASVDPVTGVVTGVAAGVAVITATSIADPEKTDISTITVTA